MKIYYKVVRATGGEVTSYVKFSPYTLVYQLGKPTKAPYNTQLFVFEDLQTAKKYCVPSIHKVFKCTVTHIRKYPNVKRLPVVWDSETSKTDLQKLWKRLHKTGKFFDNELTSYGIPIEYTMCTAKTVTLIEEV